MSNFKNNIGSSLLEVLLAFFLFVAAVLIPLGDLIFQARSMQKMQEKSRLFERISLIREHISREKPEIPKELNPQGQSRLDVSCLPEKETTVCKLTYSPNGEMEFRLWPE